jgi:hypothetical protein
MKDMANEAKSRSFAHERRRALSQATGEQREACVIVYAQHCRVCARNGIAPTDFSTFFFEWLEIQSQPVEENGNRSNDDCCHQSYDRMFEGKRGWE